VGAGATWGTADLAVVPGLVAIASRARGTSTDDLTTVLPRVGAVARIGVLAFSANAGTFARPPDPLELFGDRGALVGNPDLAAERGVQLDLGSRWSRDGAYAELVAFTSWNRDLVAWVQNAQGVARPENVARTFVGGIEAAGGWAGDPAELTANLTAVRAVDTASELFVPRVPAFELAAVGALTPDPVRLGADLSLTAGTFADRANVVLQPPRVLVGTTLTFRRGPAALELDVRNLLDERTALVPRDPLVDDGVEVPAAIVDFTGYPLPGRTFLLSLRWRT
jgi:outer membrane receptor protein involved in Fe transport